MKNKPLTNEAGDVRPLTKADFMGMRPMRELDAAFIAQVEEAKRLRGRPQGRSKKVVSISLDLDILDALRASGSGWQTRVNTLLRAAVGLQPPV